MPSKPPGGRGKRESYTSSVVRVPDPLKSQVLELIEDFHFSRPSAVAKPVTGLVQQIPVSLVVEMVEAAYPYEWDGDTFYIYCELSWKWWDKKFDKVWERESRPRAERFNLLADQVNFCIWQIDNTFAFACPEDVRVAINLLIEYGLLLPMDDSTPPARTKCLLDWVFSPDYYRNSFEDASFDAFQEQRFDMLKALGIGQHPPVNRSEYWHRKYKEQLGEPGINYWEWRYNPESREICSELTQLLYLPQPSLDTRTVLECLADGKDPFYKPEANFNGTFSDLGTYLKRGKLADIAPEQKQAYRCYFIEWHLAAINQLGRDTLECIYKVVYECSWDLIEALISPMSGEWWEVLNVSSQASQKEVKAAHRRLVKMWHPDVNSSPLATEHTSRINRAFEEYEKC